MWLHNSLKYLKDMRLNQLIPRKPKFFGCKASCYYFDIFRKKQGVLATNPAGMYVGATSESIRMHFNPAASTSTSGSKVVEVISQIRAPSVHTQSHLVFLHPAAVGTPLCLCVLSPSTQTGLLQQKELSGEEIMLEFGDCLFVFKTQT